MGIVAIPGKNKIIIIPLESISELRMKFKRLWLLLPGLKNRNSIAEPFDVHTTNRDEHMYTVTVKSPNATSPLDEIDTTRGINDEDFIFTNSFIYISSAL